MMHPDPLQEEITPPRIAAAQRDDRLIREAFRQLLREKRPFETVTIVIARPELLPLSYELTRTFALPATFAPGAPLRYSKAARTVDAWLRWLSDDYNGRHLIRMMYDGIPAPQEVLVEGERGGRLQMASMLRRAAIGGGRERLLPAVDRYIAQIQHAATSPGNGTGSSDRSVRTWRQARANRDWLTRLLDMTPETDDTGHLSLHAVAKGAKAIVQELCRDAYPGEELALAHIAEIMDRISSAPDIEMLPRDAAAHIAALLQEAHFPMVLQAPGSDAIPTTSPLPGHLHIMIADGTAQTAERISYPVGAEETDTTAPPAAVPLPAGTPPLSLAEWWLGECARGDLPAVRSALLEWNPLLREGARAEEARSSAAFTAWDGNCGADTVGSSADDFPDAAIRQFVHCPYAFFLEYLLEVAEPAPWRQSGDTTWDNAVLSVPETSGGRAPAGMQPPKATPGEGETLPRDRREQFARAIADGSFPHAEDVAACAGCPLQDVCMTARSPIPELHHLRNALRILTDPENPIPVVAFLRGPFCGVDDRALLDYRRAGGQFAFNARAIPGMDERISRGLQYIKDTVRLVRSNPPGTVIESMLERLALHAAIACSPSGWTGVAALQECFALAQRWSTFGDSIPQIVEKLDAVFDAGFFPSPGAEETGRQLHGAAEASSGDTIERTLDPVAAERDIRARFEKLI